MKKKRTTFEWIGITRGGYIEVGCGGGEKSGWLMVLPFAPLPSFINFIAISSSFSFTVCSAIDRKSKGFLPQKYLYLLLVLSNIKLMTFFLPYQCPLRDLLTAEDMAVFSTSVWILLSVVDQRMRVSLYIVLTTRKPKQTELNMWCSNQRL